MEWTQEDTLQLVDLLYEKPVLWDQKANRNKQQQIEALHEIALKSSRDVREVEKKLNYLRSQFSRELLRVRRSKLNDEEEYEPKWFAFKPLSFLIYKNRINLKQEGKEKGDLLEQSVYFTPYEQKLLDAIENSPGQNNEMFITPETETKNTPADVNVRRRSTRKSMNKVKQELAEEILNFELLDREPEELINETTTPKNHLNPANIEHPMKKMRVEQTKKLRPIPATRHKNVELINAKLKFVALQKKYLLHEQKKKDEISRLQLEHEKYKLEITKLEVEKKRLDIEIRSKMVN